MCLPDLINVPDTFINGQSSGYIVLTVSGELDFKLDLVLLPFPKLQLLIQDWGQKMNSSSKGKSYNCLTLLKQDLSFENYLINLDKKKTILILY